MRPQYGRLLSSLSSRYPRPYSAEAVARAVTTRKRVSKTLPLSDDNTTQIAKPVRRARPQRDKTTIPPLPTKTPGKTTRSSKQSVETSDGGQPESSKRERARTISRVSSLPTATKKPSTRRRQAAVPARLSAASSSKHNDLDSFLAYADRAKLSPCSSVYKGTHFEYTVAETLKSYNFALRRTGRSNDLGIDLIGHWAIPGRPEGSPLPVVVQCKANKSVRPSPAMVRELEGAYGGAPTGWRDRSSVLALLVTTQPSTQGVRAAIQRSMWPLAVMQVTAEDGKVKQLNWNASASEAGLEGLGVAINYLRETSLGTPMDEKVEGAVAWDVGLTWLGKRWRPVKVQERSVSSPIRPITDD